MQPDIQTLLTTLRRGKGAHVPLAELGIHPDIKSRMLARRCETLADDVDFWYLAGYDYIKLQPVVDFNPGRIGVPERATFQADGTTVRKWASEGSGVITTDAELDRYRFPMKGDFDYGRFEEVSALLPEGMGVIGQYGDIFTMTWEMMGFETFSLALFEHPTLVEELNTRLGELVLSIAYASGLMVAPAVLDRFFFPWLKKIGDLARHSGKPLIYHSDGVLYDVMDRILACGVDALHPIEPKAMNLGDLKRLFGDRLCLMGNVDVDLLARGTVDEVRAQVQANIAVAAADGGYCIGSSNSIPEYVKYENYMAMLEAAREFG
jgi:uroporphyrinogen decarboxylase